MWLTSHIMLHCHHCGQQTQLGTKQNTIVINKSPYKLENDKQYLTQTLWVYLDFKLAEKLKWIKGC